MSPPVANPPHDTATTPLIPIDNDQNDGPEPSSAAETGGIAKDISRILQEGQVGRQKVWRKRVYGNCYEDESSQIPKGPDAIHDTTTKSADLWCRACCGLRSESDRYAGTFLKGCGRRRALHPEIFCACDNVPAVEGDTDHG